jgi:regulatory protein
MASRAKTYNKKMGTPGETFPGASARTLELDQPAKKSRKKLLRVDDEAALSDAALKYLDKYDATKASLRRVLERKLDPALSPSERARVRQQIDALIVRLEGSRILDDARYAENLTQNLRARGTSSRAILQKLKHRGVEESAIASSTKSTTEEELDAARRLVRKKRLIEKHWSEGPTGRNKALGAMARQGFSFDVAKRALELEAASALGNDDGVF